MAIRETQTVVIEVIRDKFDKDLGKKVTFPAYYKVRGLPFPEAMGQVKPKMFEEGRSKRQTFHGNTINSGIIVTLGEKRMAFAQDPWSPEVFRRLKGYMSDRNNPNKRAMADLTYKAIMTEDPIRQKYRAWMLLELKLEHRFVIGEGRTMWAWKQKYRFTDLNYIPVNRRENKENKNSRLVWIPDQNGHGMAEDLTPKKNSNERPPKLTMEVETDYSDLVPARPVETAPEPVGNDGNFSFSGAENGSNENDGNFS